MSSRRPAPFLVVLLAVFSLHEAALQAAVRFRLRQETLQDGRWIQSERVEKWDPRKTAVVICDMWDQHWCSNATRRVAEMAPRANDFVKAARRKGMLIIHCPSDTMKFYAGTPQRLLAQQAPPVTPPVPLKGWCGIDPAQEPKLPIDDSDGGCDDFPVCPQRQPWTRQISTIEIAPRDAITDSAEAYYLMQQRGIQNVIVLGVHLNMCVLGRPFSIRQMVGEGKHVVLVRDLTDTMYNPRRHPSVSHTDGTALMIDHVERYWCATIDSASLLKSKPFVFSDAKRNFEKDIREFETADREQAPEGGDIVFTGSSSIRFWETLREDFPGIPVVNRGFGGSEMAEVATYAPRIVVPHKPKIVVVYAGSNDIAIGRSPRQVLAAFEHFTRSLRKENPNVRIAYISIAPNPKRWSMVSDFRETNRLIQEYIGTQTAMDYIDVFGPMLGSDGRPKEGIYRDDQLHMNDKGYAIWREIIGDYLHRVLQQSPRG